MEKLRVAMSGTLWILLIAIFGLPHYSGYAQDETLPFLDVSLSDAYSLAHNDGKVLMIVFGTEYCAPCLRLEREVLAHNDVAAYLKENTVAVYVDLTVRSSQGKTEYKNSSDGRAGEHYGITGFPVVVFSGAKESPDGVNYPPESGRIIGLRYSAEDGWLDANIRSTQTRAKLQRLWEEAAVADSSSKSDVLIATMFAVIREQVEHAKAL